MKAFKKFCACCLTKQVKTAQHKFCEDCLRVRQLSQKAQYKAKAKRQPNGDKETSKALAEAAELKRIAKLSKKKVKQILLTDDEQAKINLDYARRSRANINISIKDVAVRSITRSAAWLWGAA